MRPDTNCPAGTQEELDCRWYSGDQEVRTPGGTEDPPIIEKQSQDGMHKEAQDGFLSGSGPPLHIEAPQGNLSIFMTLGSLLTSHSMEGFLFSF